MNILLRLTYLFQMLPVQVSEYVFKKIQSLFSSFICGGKVPRVRISVLHLPFESGGLGLPNMKLYSWAAQLGQLKQWFKKACVWARIENNDILPLDVSYALYCVMKNQAIQSYFTLWEYGTVLISLWTGISLYHPILLYGRIQYYLLYLVIIFPNSGQKKAF